MYIEINNIFQASRCTLFRFLLYRLFPIHYQRSFYHASIVIFSKLFKSYRFLIRITHTYRLHQGTNFTPVWLSKILGGITLKKGSNELRQLIFKSNRSELVLIKRTYVRIRPLLKDKLLRAFESRESTKVFRP